MPQDPLLWLAGILVVAIVVAVAVWAKDKVDFSASGKGLRLRTGNNAARNGPKIVVAKGANVGGRVGGIVGVSGTPPGGVGGIDVATNSKINSDVDKIVGWDVTPEQKK